MMQHRMIGRLVMHVIAALHSHRQRIPKRFGEILPPWPERDHHIARRHDPLFRLNRPAFGPFAQGARVTMQKHAALTREQIRIGL